MYTGIWGEIVGAPSESLIFFMSEKGFNETQRKVVRGIIQNHKFYEPMVAALREAREKHFSNYDKSRFEDLLDEFSRRYGPGFRKYPFTDDTVLTIATMDAMLTMKAKGHYPLIGADQLFSQKYRDWARKYPEAGYGKQFRKWFKGEQQAPYYSMGNGSAMRTAPLAYLPIKLFDLLLMVRAASGVTHNHPEGIRGALAVTHATYTALHKVKSKGIIKDNVEGHYFYDLSRTLDSIRENYKFEVLAQNSVPEAIIAFLESTSAQHAAENAISLGGDTDTQAMIAGSIADAFYGTENISADVKNLVQQSLTTEMLDIFNEFQEAFVFPAELAQI